MVDLEFDKEFNELRKIYLPFLKRDEEGFGELDRNAPKHVKEAYRKAMEMLDDE